MSPKLPMPLRVAVLGASGIGKYHVREFARAGAEIVAILGSSRESALETAALLAPYLPKNAPLPSALSNLDEVFARELDAIAIATPHELHFEAALRALMAGHYVFCEKPLFWSPGLNRSEARAMLAELAMAGAYERLCVNTSNASLIHALRAQAQTPEEFHSFQFSLQTAGADEGLEIGIDLLPHAFSLLYEWAAAANRSAVWQVSKPIVEWTRHRFEARFRFCREDVGLEGPKCHFSFDVHPQAKKRMIFALNDRCFERIPRNDAQGNYSVAIRSAGGDIASADPFRAYIRQFTEAIESELPMPVDFGTSSGILLNSIEIMDAAIEGR